MNLPFSLPGWVPWWVNLVIIVPVILFGLAFLLMPFAVFGVKGRLEGVEARLDEIQGEIRSLALRLPEQVAARASEYDAPPLARAAERYEPERYDPDPVPARPPIPPAPRYAGSEYVSPPRAETPLRADLRDDRAPPPSAPPRWAEARGRAEPRFDRLR